MTHDGKIICDGGNVTQDLLVEVDGVLEQGFHVIRAVVVDKTLVGTKFFEDCFETEQAGVEASELGGGLLMEIARVIILDRRRLCSE
jgi:hypothetical protein